MTLKSIDNLIACDGCDTVMEVEDYDHVPRGWFLVYTYNNDDANNYPAKDACSTQCVTALAEEACNKLAQEDN